ncbi:hypothetical protein HUU53_03490, partial [Candidatus Micrarchaeota archaeon]|nr:hypothetical protein [Candidatus Micrarchaeota archaeon]
KKTYSLTHAAMKLLGKNATETNVTCLLVLFELVVIAIAFLLVRPV